LISSEANDISEKESKKTIACDHITKALEQLGFGAYVQEIMEVANEHKEQLKVLNLKHLIVVSSCRTNDLVCRVERRKQTNSNRAAYP
jgi:hypothetical protein